MSKKKKRRNSGGGKMLSPAALEQKVLNVLQNNLKARYNAKDVLKAISVDNTVEAVQFILEQLFEKGTLVKVANGQKYKFNRNATEGAVVEEGPVTGTKKPKELFPSRKDNVVKEKKSSAYCTGTVDTTRSGSAFIVSEDSGLAKDVFVPQGRLSNALRGDKVKVRWFMRRGKPEGEIVEVLQRAIESFIGTMVLSKQFCFVVPDDDSIPVDILISRKKTMDAQNGDKVVVRIVEWHPKHGVGNPKGEVTVVLGMSGSSDIEMKSILIKQGFDLTFPEEVLKENEEISTVILPSEINKRRDFRDVTTFTIDPETAKDFDDALSIELLENGNYEIGIHIADVTYYVTEGSALDKEAAKRTTSVYLVDRVLPMLPEKLSNGVCSLRPHEDKLTFSAVFEFTPDGEIVNEWFGKTVIHSNRRFSYEEAQEMLEGKDGDYAEEIRLLNKYAIKLRKARFKKGAISFESPEVRFKLDESGKPLEAYVKERKDSNMLVEDFMLLANRRVGAQIQDLERNGGPRIPFVYRVHDLPDMEKVANYVGFAARLGYPMSIKSPEGVAHAYNKMLKASEGKNEQAILQSLAIRTMAKAAYTTENIGHYGLAFADYSHFTSPIRRYADVLVHRIFHEYLEGKKVKINQTKLEEICKHISKRERNAMDAERESIKYKQAEYLQSHVGEVFEGVLNHMTEFGCYIELKANYCEGMARYENMYDNFVLMEDGYHIRSQSKTYKMGDTVYVRIMRVDLSKRQVDLALIEESEAIAELAEGPKAKEAEVKVEEIHVVNQPKHPKQRSAIDKIYDQIATTYEMSDLRKHTQKFDKEWAFALSETPEFKQSLVLLGFNPKADADETYLAQTHLPTETLDKTIWKKAIPFFNEYLSEYPLESIVETYFCPFRSQEEGQISKNDLEAILPVFHSWMKELQPKQILSFSGRLRDFFLLHNMLTAVEDIQLTSGKRNIRVVKGFMKVGRKKVRVAFLPSINTSMSKEVRAEMWTFVTK